MDNVMARHWFIVAKPGSYCGCLDSCFPVLVLCVYGWIKEFTEFSVEVAPGSKSIATGAVKFSWKTGTQVRDPQLQNQWRKRRPVQGT